MMTSNAARPAEDRPMHRAMLRGWRCRCPNCGAGPMLRGYLDVRESCAVCGEALHPCLSDDRTAYVTLLIVGHLMAPMILYVVTAHRPDPLILVSVVSVGAVGLSLWLMPRLKGMWVGLQWARRRHGLGPVTRGE